ncbi:MAG: YCF48-related protein [Candidatus Binataceae bacterium]
MKAAKSLCLSLAAVLIMGLALSACSHEEAKGIPAKTDTMGPRPWEPLYGVAVHSGTWFIVGARGMVLTTDDQGKTWHRRTLINRDFYSIRFSPSGKVAWITGEDGLIYFSDDGGKTWTAQKSGTEDRLLKIGIVDDQKAAVAASDGTMLYTADGGKTWTPQKFKDITFFDIVMNPNGEGWAVGEFETILHTTDGGKTWDTQKGGITRDFRVGPYFAVDFEKDNQNGWVVGLNGEVISTSDGGKTWHDNKLPINRAMYVAVGEDKALWMAGADGTFIEAKLNQQQLGDWKVENPTFNDIADLTIQGDLQVAVGLNGTVLFSPDNGAHWQTIHDSK